tara:strand:+ start:348 stop:497 length:150 start_codon:yes stop_codon:yes gene_type:complete
MNSFNNSICSLFDIDYPIIQAGMVWASGWRLASAVSNAELEKLFLPLFS